MIRSSTAIWKGPGRTGQGQLSTESRIMSDTTFDFQGRFSSGSGMINPEELIAAAHAIDIVMKLSFVLGEAGYIPETIHVTAHINFVNGSIVASHLILLASVPGISKQLFDAGVKEAALTCPVSRALKIDITTEGRLE